MPFGIPSEDFHGGFGLPHDDDDVIDTETSENCGSAARDDYDPYTGKYAFCPPIDDDVTDEELETAAEDAYNGLVRSLIEAGGEIRELKDEKRRLIWALKEAVEWLNYFLTNDRDNIYYDEASEARCRAVCVLFYSFNKKSGRRHVRPKLIRI